VLRNYIWYMGLVPLAFFFDLNGGYSKLGFTKQTFEEEYKVRPDYLTHTLFVAHRQQVPQFKQF